MVGEGYLGVEFNGFYCEEIKDQIKSIAGARWAPKQSIWYVPIELRETLVERVGAPCVESGVQIFDIPSFVHDFQKYPLPLSNYSKKVAVRHDYGSEAKHNDRNLDQLPQTLKDSLYDFQKKGIEFGI